VLVSGVLLPQPTSEEAARTTDMVTNSFCMSLAVAIVKPMLD
jgi:hypothetical protein